MARAIGNVPTSRVCGYRFDPDLLPWRRPERLFVATTATRWRVCLCVREREVLDEVGLKSLSAGFESFESWCRVEFVECPFLLCFRPRRE